MAHVFADLVLEASSQPAPVGAAFSLDGAPTGYNTFGSACKHGDTLHYMAREVDATGRPVGDWEIGRGTYRYLNNRASLGRDIVVSSSKAGAFVPFKEGQKLVQLACVAPGSDLIKRDWRDALGVEIKAGSLMEYAGSEVPAGYYKCDGSERNRVGDEDLYRAIGVKFGAGDGAKTFNLPVFKSARDGCMVCIKH